AVFVVFGKSGITDIDLNSTPLNGTNGFTIVGGLYDRIGASIAVGDLNGDGVADLAIAGWIYAAPTNHQALYVVFRGGTPSLPAIVSASSGGPILVDKRNAP